MEGMARAAARNFDLAVIEAWHTEAFQRTKRLKKLSAYLDAGTRPAKTHQPGAAQARAEETLAAFRSWSDKGMAVSITRLN